MMAPLKDAGYSLGAFTFRTDMIIRVPAVAQVCEETSVEWLVVIVAPAHPSSCLWCSSRQEGLPWVSLSSLTVYKSHTVKPGVIAQIKTVIRTLKCTVEFYYSFSKILAWFFKVRCVRWFYHPVFKHWKVRLLMPYSHIILNLSTPFLKISCSIYSHFLKKLYFVFLVLRTKPRAFHVLDKEFITVLT